MKIASIDASESVFGFRNRIAIHEFLENFDSRRCAILVLFVHFFGGILCCLGKVYERCANN